MRGLTKFLIFLSILAAIALGVGRATAIRWWRVPSDDPFLEASLAPTLRGGDWLLLWRLTAPKLGDLVVCPEPGHPERIVVGRIAALQGQTIDIKGSTVRVDGRRVASAGSCSENRFTIADPNTGNSVEQNCDREELGSRVHLRATAAGVPAPHPHESTVGPGEVFLLSDNRAFPYDSREFGPVERATCRESVIFRVVSAAGYRDVDSRLTLIR